MRGHTPSTSFTKGCAPGPGRPKGAKDRFPRGSIKAAWDRVMATREGYESLDEAIRAGLKDRRQRLGFLELGARLNREIGPGADVAALPVTVIINGTPLDPSKLR